MTTSASPDVAGRADIIDAAGADLDPKGGPGSPSPSRPPSVLYAQAIALRSNVAAAVQVVDLLRKAIASGVEPAALDFILTACAIQLEAGVVQCDSFLVMAEAMSAAMPGARPGSPTTPAQPKVFGGGKRDERPDAHATG
jgi:hypothetical protein